MILLLPFFKVLMVITLLFGLWFYVVGQFYLHSFPY
ncbi:Uncharacterised protein [Leclercia adecarboxylata]|uniref:Uncharacterized protein n=1 Tax=Leclercia adecarboxylata TaxID=83655 RepID=A0A4U9HQJ4_9ENTR|nr:Uncharacterised protein [Leclercia adecarboxylata]